MVILTALLNHLHIAEPQFQILPDHDFGPYGNHILFNQAAYIKVIICIVRYVKGTIPDVPHVKIVIRCFRKQIQEDIRGKILIFNNISHDNLQDKYGLYFTMTRFQCPEAADIIEDICRYY